MSPLVLGLVWIGDMMVFLGMRLNLFNTVVFPSVAGIGVNVGVHTHGPHGPAGLSSSPDLKGDSMEANAGSAS